MDYYSGDALLRQVSDVSRTQPALIITLAREILNSKDVQEVIEEWM